MWKEDDTLAAEVSKLFPEIAGALITQVQIELKYWRKFNALHLWLVKNVQNGDDECQDSLVSEEHLVELRRVCRAVLADNQSAATLLPTGSGFFFGSTEYDSYYFNNVQGTLDVVDRLLTGDALNPAMENWDIHYHASW
jgi:hypothetical protein